MSEITYAAEQLLAARDRKEPVTAPPVSSRESAYAIQAEIARRAGGFGNWKIAFFVPTDLIFAPILARTVVESPAVFPPSSFNMIGIEGEMVVRLDAPVPAAGPVLSRENILALICEVRVAIEVVDTRLLDLKAAPEIARIADNMSSGALVLGEALADWRSADLAAPGFAVLVNGEVAVEPGRNRIGDIIGAIGQLLDHCRGQGIDLPAGVRISTGSSTGVIFVSEGDHVALVADGRTLAEARF